MENLNKLTNGANIDKSIFMSNVAKMDQKIHQKHGLSNNGGKYPYGILVYNGTFLEPLEFNQQTTVEEFVNEHQNATKESVPPDTCNDSVELSSNTKLQTFVDFDSFVLNLDDEKLYYCSNVCGFRPGPPFVYMWTSEDPKEVIPELNPEYDPSLQK